MDITYNQLQRTHVPTSANTNVVIQNTFNDWLISSDLSTCKYELSKRAEKILGKNGVKRFKEFKQYQDYWDGKTGKRLKYSSVGCLESFLSRYEDLMYFAPNIFLTREGNLQISWKDQNRKDIEIEFFPESIEFYVESKNIESTLGIDEIESFKNIFR